MVARLPRRNGISKGSRAVNLARFAGDSSFVNLPGKYAFPDRLNYIRRGAIENALISREIFSGFRGVVMQARDMLNEIGKGDFSFAIRLAIFLGMPNPNDEDFIIDVPVSKHIAAGAKTNRQLSTVHFQIPRSAFFRQLRRATGRVAQGIDRVLGGFPTVRFYKRMESLAVIQYLRQPPYNCHQEDSGSASRLSAQAPLYPHNRSFRRSVGIFPNGILSTGAQLQGLPRYPKIAQQPFSQDSEAFYPALCPRLPGGVGSPRSSAGPQLNLT